MLSLFLFLQSRPKLVEPLDYENVIVKNRTILHNDPQRDMLLFPHDDVTVSTEHRHVGYYTA